MQRDRRNVRLSLASLDVLGDDAQLRANAEGALQERDAHQLTGPHAGRDQTGTVTVLVGDDGEVREVTVSRDWRRRVGPAAVGDAVFEAYAMGVQSALEAAAARQLRREPVVVPPAASGPESATADEVDEHLWLRRVWRTLHDIDTDLDRLARQPEAVAEQTVTSPHGGLTARLRAGSIVAVTGDPDRVARLDAGQLRFEILSLLRTCALVRSRDRS